MAFHVPAMPLTFSAWRLLGFGGVYAVPDLQTSGCLSVGERHISFFTNLIPTALSAVLYELLIPRGTDLRCSYNGAAPDLVECPAGSKCFYQVWDVADVAKGFSNEYRLAVMKYVLTGNTTLVGGPFPAPVPLP